MNNADIYKLVTDRIIQGLKDGNIPWKAGYKSNFNMPVNYTTKKHYNGVNVLILAVNMMQNGYKSPYYLTFKQVQKLKGKVKKGSKSELIIYWNWLKKDSGQKDSKGEPLYKKFALLKYYRVFNIEQTEGIEYENPQPINNNNDLIKDCENFINGYKNHPEIKESIGTPCYIPSKDIINIPNKDSFENSKYYYSTLFHELVHSTGHKDKLNRDSVVNSDGFGGYEYSKEELIAEIGTSFICSILGIRQEEVEKNQQAYINSWIKKLESNPKWIISASGKAQKAVEYMQSQPEKE